MGKNYIAPDVSLLNEYGLDGLKRAIANQNFIHGKNTFVVGRGKDGYRYLNLNTDNVLLKSNKTDKKQACLHSIILSMLFKYSPEDLKFIFIDTKNSELDVYGGLPHSLTPSPVSDFGQALGALQWAVLEGERRYSLFSKMNDKGLTAPNINRYNELNGVRKLPAIVIVLNDLADLINRAAQAYLNVIIRILQKLRWAGIHLIMVTQSEDKRVLSNLILSNLQTKILYKNIGGNSEIILISDQSGGPEYLRGLCVDEKEIIKVTDFIKNNNCSHFSGELEEKMNKNDELQAYDEQVSALKFCLKNKSITLESLQGELSISKERAQTLFGWLENNDFISSDGEKRQVLITEKQFISLYGKLL